MPGAPRWTGWSGTRQLVLPLFHRREERGGLEVESLAPAHTGKLREGPASDLSCLPRCPVPAVTLCPCVPRPVWFWPAGKEPAGKGLSQAQPLSNAAPVPAPALPPHRAQPAAHGVDG